MMNCKISVALAFCCDVESRLVCVAVQAEVCDLRQHVPARGNCIRSQSGILEWMYTILLYHQEIKETSPSSITKCNDRLHGCMQKDGNYECLTQAMKVVFAKIHLLHVPQASPRRREGACRGSRTDKQSLASFLALVAPVNKKYRFLLCSTMGRRSFITPVSSLDERSKYVKHPKPAHSAGKVPEHFRIAHVKGIRTRAFNCFCGHQMRMRYHPSL